MKTPRHVFIVAVLLGLGGAALMVTLFIHHGIKDITIAVAAAGWGVAAVVLFHIVPMLFDVLGWQVLIPRASRLRFRTLLVLRWIGDSVSAMLPVAQVGGEVVRVRLAAIRGMPLPIAAASVLAGMTVSVATQIVFTLTGLAILLIVTGHSMFTSSMLMGLLLSVAAVGGFYVVQRSGMFRLVGVILAHLAKSEAWSHLVEKGEELDVEVRNIYSRRQQVLLSCLWTMFVWATGAVEVWIALWALGVHSSYAKSYIFESASQAIRSAMFVVPGALGVQEGGYLVIGLLLGISGETAMALAMIRRVRELAYGIPGVIAWQYAEGRHLFAKRSKQLTHSAGQVPPATPAGADPVPAAGAIDPLQT